MIASIVAASQLCFRHCTAVYRSWPANPETCRKFNIFSAALMFRRRGTTYSPKVSNPSDILYIQADSRGLPQTRARSERKKLEAAKIIIDSPTPEKRSRLALVYVLETDNTVGKKKITMLCVLFAGF